MNKSDERLLEYITTGNFKHPDGIDISAFGEYGGLHDRCPFCELHNSNKNPLTVVLQENNILGKTNIRTEKVFLCDQHAQVYKKFKDVKVNDSSTLNPRLRHFLLTEELPHDSIFYTHDNEFKDQCVFCSRDLGMNFSTLQIEQGKYDVITAPVKVCNKCSELIDDQEKHYSGHCNPLIATDKCKLCDQKYPITLAEERTRELNNTKGNHICNDCLNTTYGILNEPRFEELECQTCQDKGYVDNTLNPEIKVYYCPQHKPAVANPYDNDSLVLFTVGDNEEVSIEVLNLFGRWIYTGYDTITRKVLFNSENTKPGGFQREETAMYRAAFEALTLIEKMYNQTKLFP